jgi:AcrR family transcriptional regulator
LERPGLSGEHRTKRGEERVRALKEAATDLFLEDGFDAVSVDGLIARVGGSRRNVYDHFGGKEGLFVEAVAALCEELSRPLHELQIQGSDPQRCLTVFGQKLLEIVLQPRTIALHRLMIAEGRRFPDLAQSIWRAGHTNAQRILAKCIREGQAADLLRNDIEAEDLASDFINLTITSIQLKALVGLEQEIGVAEIENATSAAVAMFLNGAFKTYHVSNKA